MNTVNIFFALDLHFLSAQYTHHQLESDGKFMIVQKITRQQYLPFLLHIHYARRSPSVSFAYGLFIGDHLEGVVTYGTPASDPLRRGVAGDAYKSNILELNRLCLISNERNHASFLVAKSLRMIQKNKIVVSFADTSKGHIGYVYQAANFLYCGLSAKRTDWKLKGREHLHGQTIADEFRGMPNRVQAMRDKYGDDFYLAPRPRKHRYIYITGTKRFKKDAKANLRYAVLPFPKKDAD
jgi:hypothetical protein